MSGQFLETKFHIPPMRPEYIQRRRLTEQLDAGLPGKLTLISAPAGFGKTSLISGWMAETDRDPAWLSLDKGDNDPVRFLGYMIGALQMSDHNFGNEAMSLLHSTHQNAPEIVLTSLINEAASRSTGFILVLDDYHLIEKREIDQILIFLIDHLPPHMHLVISTREDPQLALSRLRASGQLNELRASDLRFHNSEITEFMNKGMKLNLSADDIGSLEKRTEGWIASLQLAALSLQKQPDVTRFIQSFTGSHRLVLDYLVEEVLSQQTDEIQDFLIQTSFLDRICGPLCDELTGGHNGRETLEILENSNLFIIPLDDERYWYRYHHLFAELLRQRFRESRAERLPMLHKQAGLWFSQNGFNSEAIEHALQSGDFELAIGWIEAYLGENFEKITQATRERWLETIPEEYLGTRPYLALLESWSMVAAGRLDKSERCLKAVEQAAAPAEAENREGRLQWTQCLAMAAAFRSFIETYRGNFDASIQYGNKALDFHRTLISELDPDNIQSELMRPRSFALIVLACAYEYAGLGAEAGQTQADAIAAAEQMEDAELISFAGIVTAESLMRQGRLHEAADICRDLMSKPKSRDITENPKSCWLLGFYSYVLAELNETSEALEQAELAAVQAALCDDGFYIIHCNIFTARTFFSCGEPARAGEAIQIVESLSNHRSLPLPEMLITSAWKARLLLAEGNLDEAARWAAEHNFNPDEKPTRLHETEYFTLARIWIAQGRADEAILLLEWAEPPARSDNRVTAVIEALSLKALGYQAAEKPDKARELLKQALDLAEPRGFFRVFIDEGPSMARLLYDAAKEGLQPGYIRRLLAEFPTSDPASVKKSDTASHQNELIEPLSARELDVLRLMAEGMSNEDIGGKLFISVHTVKVHTRNIYGKLDTHNRTEAVARARNYGILTLD